MNRNMVEVFGRDMTGERCWDGFRGKTERCRDCTNDQLLDENKKPAGAYVWQGKNPLTERWCINHDRAIEWTDGRLVKLQIATDITDLQRMEQQLQQGHKMEAIGTLAGGIAHQFNNALSGITGAIDLLAMDFPGDETVAAYTRTMKKAAHRMTRLTAQLLAYARGGRHQVKMVSLCDFVKETLPLVQHQTGAAIQVDTDLPEETFNVNVDLTQMQMVLSAVLTNAAEAMGHKGRIRITCRNETLTDERVASFPGLTPGNYVSLKVADDSRGMDEETRKRIFEPFFTTKFQGRGLGMAAAYGIVKSHHGWISVESELGKGTRVKIYLPAVQTPDKADVQKRPAAQWVKGTGTILVIDDDETIRVMCRTMLERMGYRVLSAGSGQAAIEAVNTFDGDIEFALLDILLPDMNGSAIYPLLKQARPDLKVIVFSGYSSDGPVREILDAGAQAYIQKPFTMADLSEKLKKT